MIDLILRLRKYNHDIHLLLYRIIIKILPSFCIKLIYFLLPYSRFTILYLLIHLKRFSLFSNLFRSDKFFCYSRFRLSSSYEDTIPHSLTEFSAWSKYCIKNKFLKVPRSSLNCLYLYRIYSLLGLFEVAHFFRLSALERELTSSLSMYHLVPQRLVPALIEFSLHTSSDLSHFAESFDFSISNSLLKYIRKFKSQLSPSSILQDLCLASDNYMSSYYRSYSQNSYINWSNKRFNASDYNLTKSLFIGPSVRQTDDIGLDDFDYYVRVGYDKSNRENLQFPELDTSITLFKEFRFYGKSDDELNTLLPAKQLNFVSFLSHDFLNKICSFDTYCFSLFAGPIIFGNEEFNGGVELMLNILNSNCHNLHVINTDFFLNKPSFLNIFHNLTWDKTNNRKPNI